MFGGNIVDQLHQRHRFSYTGSPEQTNFAALGNGHNQIDNFNTSFQNLYRSSLIGISRCLTVDGQSFLGLNRAGFIYRFSQHIDHPTQGGLADGN